MKKIIRAAYAGIRVVAVIFLLTCIVMGFMGGSEKFASNYGMARAGTAVILIGIGFGIPTLVYETKLRMGFKVLIHMGIGCLVMFGASVLGGWLPIEQGISSILITAAAQIVVAFIIWGVYFIPVLVQTKRINEKIQKQSSQK